MFLSPWLLELQTSTDAELSTGDGESGKFPGIYTRKDGSSYTWRREGATSTPGPQPAGKSSNCRPYPTISNGPAKFPPQKREAASSMQTVVARGEYTAQESSQSQVGQC